MKRIVLANGCFDVLHVGHIWHLRQAKRLGDRLIVALTVDTAVNKGPGLPINQWNHRAEVLRALRYVDLVTPSTSCHEAIREIRPHVFVKGCDYEHSPLLGPARKACREVGAILHITTTAKLASSDIIRRMQTSAGVAPSPASSITDYIRDVLDPELWRLRAERDHLAQRLACGR